jgi:hypothetical protein
MLIHQLPLRDEDDTAETLKVEALSRFLYYCIKL